MQRWISPVVALALVAVIWGGVKTSTRHYRVSPEVLSTAPRPSLDPSSVPTVVERKNPTPKRSESVVLARKNAWKDFQSLYGSNLKGDFTEDGRIASIKNEAHGNPVPDFKKGDKGAALAQAKKIVQDSQELLGLNSEFPLESSDSRSDEISSQVEFNQTKNGIPFSPHGKVTVQLESDGGLRAIYSDYVSNIKLINERSLSAEEVFGRISDALDTKLRDDQFKSQSANGQLVIFVPGPQTSETPVQAQYGYRFWVEGREIIASASTGTILFQRDRRQF